MDNKYYTDALNERFGTNFGAADEMFFEQIEAELMADTMLKDQAKANKLDAFKYPFNEIFFNKMLNRMDKNQELFDKTNDNKSFGDSAKKSVMKKVYAKLCIMDILQECNLN